MTLPVPALSQHLLTDSDLARLAVPEASIQAWLADSLLDPVGSLPGVDAKRDAVFAVTDRDLRLYLATKLAAIGKDEIVFAPARVRSMLQRAMGSKDDVPGAAPATLEVTVEMIAADAEAFVEMTRQEAQLEAIELAASTSEADEVADDDVDCFDAADLIGELDTWGGPDAPAPATFEVPADQPFREAPTAAPAPAPVPAVEVSPAASTTESTALAFAAEPVASVVADQPPASALSPVAATSRGELAEPETSPTMTRVESFLGELRHVLVELANRPQAQPVDMRPLVAAVQSGFVHSAEGASATNSALTSLTDRLGDFGQRVEAGVALAVRSALDHETANHSGPAQPAPFVVEKAERSTLALFGIGFLLLCWTAIFWFKTGNPRLALGTLVGANLIGCCLVVGRRRNG